MPRLVPIRLAAACALALTSMLLLAAAAVAKGPVAELRVVGKGGKVLSEGPLGLAGSASVKASPQATCFGAGSGGSGKKVSVKTATALGMLIRAAEFQAALAPLLITDHFVAEFGLGLCGVGGVKATKTSSWFVKVNHKVPSLGGEKVKVRGGDEVLWAYGAYPYPDELVLQAPGQVQAGKPFGVRAFSYDEKGKKEPASGVTVSGASGPTDGAGRATVTLAAPARLTARGGGDIPSAGVPVCVGGRCPKG
jgi:hypothetical protein